MDDNRDLAFDLPIGQAADDMTDGTAQKLFMNFTDLASDDDLPVAEHFEHLGQRVLQPMRRLIED